MTQKRARATPRVSSAQLRCGGLDPNRHPQTKRLLTPYLSTRPAPFIHAPLSAYPSFLMDAALLNVVSPEVQKLHQLLVSYEGENLRLKGECAQARHEVEVMRLHQVEENKRFHGLSKKISSLESNMRLEKRASDGLTKKTASLDIECTLLKEQDKVFREEQIMNRRKVKEYEDTLCEDRAKRLRDMHECELLRRKNAELEGKLNVAESGATKARRDLLDCMQRLDTALAQVENGQRTVEAQGEEMLSLNREVAAFKETVAGMGETVLRLERVAAERTAERDILEHEGNRLRTELINMATTHGERSIAFGSRVGSSQSRSRPGTGTGLSRASFSASGRDFFPQSPSGVGVSFGGSTVFDDSSSSSTLSRPSSSSVMLSPVASQGRPRSQGGLMSPISASKPATPLPPPAIKRGVQLAVLDTSLPYSASSSHGDGDDDGRDQDKGDSNSQVERTLQEGGGSSVLTGPSGLEDPQAVSRERRGTKGKPKARGVADKCNTMYRGSGLNFRTEPIPQPKESAKQVLRKILLEFQAQ